VIGLGGGRAVLDDILPVPALLGASRRLALQLLYVVYQGKQLPLCVNFASGSKRESLQAVIVETR
jgi:hypothetical protein